MDFFGYLFGAVLRTLVVLMIFYFIVRAFRRPLTRSAARICGIVMFLIFTILPIIMTGEVIINIILGVLTGYFSFSIANTALSRA